ncbi:hypothetical protein CUMW_236780 [Citrus unshiu]|uniref:Terpene synthase metal-binding domain-containing protein n=1 Tax=Citrus unshiu TaxID=55188 RepID=A0A2H5QJR1_CITUN|nr:hypothetical protein CUMW_236780 [Citrus unshiu]
MPRNDISTDIQSKTKDNDYMQLSFLALYNTINEMAYDTLKQHGEIIIPYLTEAVSNDLRKSFLQDAKWNYNNYTPTFEEYLENAWQSSGELFLIRSHFSLSRSINKEALKSLEKYHDLMSWPSIIFRLFNDFATSNV